jgi:hypothetical protein
MPLVVKSYDELLPTLRQRECVWGFAGGIDSLLGEWLSGAIERWAGLMSHAAVSFATHGSEVWIAQAGPRGMVIEPLRPVLDGWASAWCAVLRPLPDRETAIRYACSVCAQIPGQPPSGRQVGYQYSNFLEWIRFINGHGTRPDDDDSRLFCSEFVGFFLRHGGIPVSSPEVMPLEAFQWHVYEDDYYAVQVPDGEQPRKIVLFNYRDPSTPLPDHI